MVSRETPCSNYRAYAWCAARLGGNSEDRSTASGSTTGEVVALRIME
jgi:hypothetical protein